MGGIIAQTDTNFREKTGGQLDMGFEDAKLMLVAASAFVNYLKEKAIKAGVDFKE